MEESSLLFDDVAVAHSYLDVLPEARLTHESAGIASIFPPGFPNLPTQTGLLRSLHTWSSLFPPSPSPPLPGERTLVFFESSG